MIVHRMGAALAVGICALYACAAQAATLYVSTTGTDTNPGTQAQPFLTLTRGVRDLKPGDTLLVMPGLYAESLYGIIPGGTDWNNPVTVKAYDPSNRPIMKPNANVGAYRVIEFGGNWPIPASQQHYIIIDGFILDGVNVSDSVIKIEDGAHHIRVMNSELMNAPNNGVLVYTPEIGNNEFLNLDVHDNGNTDFAHGLYIANNDNVIDGCRIYRNAGWGVHVWNSYYPSDSTSDTPSRNSIRNNIIYDNARVGGRGPGIGLYQGMGNKAYNNIVVNNNVGIVMDYGATDTFIGNNVVYKNKSNGILVGITATNNTYIYNNIVAESGYIGISVYQGSNYVRNNLGYHNTVDEPTLSDYAKNYLDYTGTAVAENNIFNPYPGLDPQFVNPENRDFHLRAGSPAINTGLALADVTTDITGTARPQGFGYDIGAYEYVKGADYYVSPTGTPQGDGSKTNPWDLQTALADNTNPANKNFAVKPGDTIWLRGGEYVVDGLASYIQGASGNYVSVRQYPGERATILGRGTSVYHVGVHGEWVNYWGFEIAGNDTIRYSAQGGQTPTDITRKDGFTFFVPHVRAINLIIHDFVGLGISCFSAASNSELYGNIIYYNGYLGSDRPHGHGVYSQNVEGAKDLIDNIVFLNFDEGIQLYGSEIASVINYSISGNTAFNNGNIFNTGTRSNFYIGAGTMKNIVFENNYIYADPTKKTGGLFIGNLADPTTTFDIALRNNYIADFVYLINWQSIEFTGNTLVKPVGSNLIKLMTPGSVPAYMWNNNAYYSSTGYGLQLADNGQVDGYNLDFQTWKSRTGFDAQSTFTTAAMPSSNAIFVRANKYEGGRANITIYNWAMADSVDVDISSVDLFDQDAQPIGKGPLLQVGDHYELHNVQDYFNDVIRATFTGSPIRVPLTGHSIAMPVGLSSLPESSFPEFGAFVLIKTAVLYGDVSGDGFVTAFDAALALQQGRSVFEAAQIGMRAVGCLA